MSGNLFIYKEEVEPNFCFVVDGKINNKAYWNERYRGIRRTDSSPNMVMHIKDFDLTKEATATAAAAAVATGTGSTGVMVAEDYGKARKEWEKTGKIQGGIFLTMDSKLIWISHIDLKYFKKVDC